MQLLRICRHSFGVNVEIMHLLLLQAIIQHVSAYTLLLGVFYRAVCLFFKPVLTLRSLTLYIYMEHLFLMFLDHTQRRSTVGRTPLDE